MDSQALRMTRILSTIPVNSIDSKTHKPCSMGSGCFVNYKGHLIFLTVLHAVEVKTDILHGIVVDYDSEKCRTVLYEVNDFSICAMGDLRTKEVDIIDFAMKKFSTPMPPCKFLINKNHIGEFEKIDRIPLTSDLSVAPTTNEKYGFCGLIKGSLIETETVLRLYSTLAYYDNLRYLKSENSYHIFVLENKNYSHKDFQGTSGAPIIDSKGNLVSLVMSGHQSPNNSNEWIIYGVNLSKFSTVIDVTCDLI